jgi:hypothetical protein
MTVDLIMELIALTVLVGYLVFRQWQLARNSPDYRKGDPARAGQGLDAGPIRSGLARVRRDFPNAAHASPDLHNKRMLLREFHHAVVRLGSFRDKAEEEPEPSHATR